MINMFHVRLNRNIGIPNPKPHKENAYLVDKTDDSFYKIKSMN